MDDCDYSKAETKYGEIILDEAYVGEVYVNGLFVDCNSDLKYGYNFKPKYIGNGKGRHPDGKSAEDGRGKS